MGHHSAEQLAALRVPQRVVEIFFQHPQSNIFHAGVAAMARRAWTRTLDPAPNPNPNPPTLTLPSLPDSGHVGGHRLCLRPGASQAFASGLFCGPRGLVSRILEYHTASGGVKPNERDGAAVVGYRRCLYEMALETEAMLLTPTPTPTPTPTLTLTLTP